MEGRQASPRIVRREVGERGTRCVSASRVSLSVEYTVRVRGFFTISVFTCGDRGRCGRWAVGGPPGGAGPRTLRRSRGREIISGAYLLQYPRAPGVAVLLFWELRGSRVGRSVSAATPRPTATPTHLPHATTCARSFLRKCREKKRRMNENLI